MCPSPESGSAFGLPFPKVLNAHEFVPVDELIFLLLFSNLGGWLKLTMIPINYITQTNAFAFFHN